MQACIVWAPAAGEMERLRLTGGPHYDYGQPPVSCRRCTRAHRPLPMLSDAIRKRLQPKEASLLERDAMLPAHYESSLVTYAAQSDRRNSLEARARLPQHASRTPPESSGVV